MAIALLKLVDLIFWVYLIMIFIRIIGSWIPELMGTRIWRFTAFYVDPYLNLFRRIIPPLGMIDISPIIAIFCLSLIEGLLKTLIVTFFS